MKKKKTHNILNTLKELHVQILSRQTLHIQIKQERVW